MKTHAADYELCRNRVCMLPLDGTSVFPLDSQIKRCRQTILDNTHHEVKVRDSPDQSRRLQYPS